MKTQNALHYKKAVTLRDNDVIFISDANWGKQSVYAVKGHAPALIALPAVISCDRKQETYVGRFSLGQKVRVNGKAYIIAAPGFLGGDSCVLEEVR